MKIGYYSTGSHFLSKTLVDIPFTVLIGFLYGIITFKSSHQIDDDFRLWSFVGVITMTAIVAQGCGHLAVIISGSSHDRGVLLTLFFGFTLSLINRNFAPIEEWPQWLSTSTDGLSITSGGYELLVYLIYGFSRCPTGLTPKLLWTINLDDHDLFLNNLYRFVAIKLIGIRLLTLVILLFKTR
mgnify:CR=1 FL=1